MWFLLAYQSVCWSPGFLRVTAALGSSPCASPKLLQLRSFPSPSFSFLYNPAILALSSQVFLAFSALSSFLSSALLSLLAMFSSTTFSFYSVLFRIHLAVLFLVYNKDLPLNHTLEQSAPRFIYLGLKIPLYIIALHIYLHQLTFN